MICSRILGSVGDGSILGQPPSKFSPGKPGFGGLDRASEGVETARNRLDWGQQQDCQRRWEPILDFVDTGP